MDTPTSPQIGQPVDISWSGKGSDYIGIGFKVFFLKIITLGIYHFWGKTEIRKKLWNHIRLNNEPLEYTGTGMELFLGFLIVIGAVFIPMIIIVTALQLAFANNPIMMGLSFAAFYLVFFYLIGVAIYSAQKYRLSRTQWRGIRGALKGSRWKYGWTAFWTTLVSIITLGLAVPWQSIKLNKIITDDTHFGETAMRFTGNWQQIFRYYIVPWIAGLGGYALLIYLLFPLFQQISGLERSGVPVDPKTIVLIQLTILGYVLAFGLIMSVIYAWYQSKYYNYIAKETKFSNGEFSLNTTPGGLIWLTVSNFFIVLFSLGILGAVAAGRMFGYFAHNMSFNGNVDVNGILQSQEQLSKTGEGLAEGFDLDAF